MKKILILSSFFLLFAIHQVKATTSASAQYYYDVKVEDIYTIPAKPASGQRCMIVVKAKNVGTKGFFSAAGVGSFSYKFPDFSLTSLNYNTPSYDASNMVPAGGYVTYYFDGKFNSAGQRNLIFSVNSDKSMVEEKLSDDGFTVPLYGDDTATKTLDVIYDTGADLSVESMSVDSDFPITGKQINITITVKNKGKVSIISSSALEGAGLGFNFSAVRATSTKLPTFADPMDENETVVYTYGVVFDTPGEKKLEFILDKGNVLKEVTKDNNIGKLTLNVLGSQLAADEFSYSVPEINPLGSTSLLVLFTTSKNASSTVYYGVNDNIDVYQYIEVKDKQVHEAVITGLIPDMKYSVHTIIKKGDVSKQDSIRSGFTAKNDQPHFVDEPGAVVENKTATIRWKTDLAVLSTVYYKKTGDASYTSSSTLLKRAGQVFVLPNLGVADYDYYISVKSDAGIIASSSIKKFKVATVATAVQPATTPITTTTKTTVVTNTGTGAVAVISSSNNALFGKLKGKIVLKVESGGEAYYLNPKTGTVNFLGKPDDAYKVMREQGVGIKNADLQKIQIGADAMSGVDTDGDGLPDLFEDAIGTDKNKTDTDGDGYGDKEEVAGGFNPSVSGGKMPINPVFSTGQKGKIFLQIENRGEAWYINPNDNKRYFLGRAADAFGVMRKLGLGISNKDFTSLSK